MGHHSTVTSHNALRRQTLKGILAGMLCAVICTLGACTAKHGVTQQPKPFLPDSLALIPQSAKSNVHLTPEQQKRYKAIYLSSVNERLVERYDAAYDLLEQALDINPDAPEALADMAALKLSKASQSDTLIKLEALQLMKRAHELVPSNIYYLEDIAQLYTALDSAEQSTACYERIVARKPTSNNLLNLAASYYAKEDYARTLETIDYYERKEGDSPAVQMQKMVVYFAQRDTATLYPLMQQYITDNPDETDNILRLGATYETLERNDMALKTYLDVLQRDSLNVSAMGTLWAFYKKNEQDSLFWDLTKKVVLSPDIPFWNRFQLLSVCVKDSTIAADTVHIKDLFTDMFLMDDDQDFMRGLGYTVFQNYAMPDAEKEQMLRDITQQHPDRYAPYLYLLGILSDSDTDGSHTEEIVTMSRECERKFPKRLNFYVIEGITLYQSGQTEAAYEAFLKGETVAADTTDGEKEDIYATFYSYYAEVLFEKGKIKEAFDAYEKAMELNESDTGVLNNYAYKLSELGQDLTKAEEMSSRIVAEEPDNATFLDTHAWVLYKEKKYNEAKVYIDKAILNMSFDEPSVYYFDHAGDIYLKLGLKEEAVQFWQRALDFSTDADITKSIIRKIKRNGGIVSQ